MRENEHLEMTITTTTGHLSPGASPDDRDILYGIPKGWCSERVPHHHNHHRHVAALVPFGSGSGRAFPSKWDDAERWISSSPGSVPNNYYYATGVTKVTNSSSHPQMGRSRYERRAKSKSGPLGLAGLTSYGSLGNAFSPVLGMGVIHGGRWRNSAVVEERADGGGGGDGGRRSCRGLTDPDWMDLWSGPPSPTVSGHLKRDGGSTMEGKKAEEKNENEEGIVDGSVSRRDMATQMYCNSYSSSPCSSIGPSTPSDHYELVRDVQVDKQTSTTRRSASSQGGGEQDIQHTTSLVSSFIDTAHNKFPKVEKEESRINAWENLQKAKAEAALQKLEMKLEKKRTTAMEKIIEKLNKAEIKAEKMRSALSTDNKDEKLFQNQNKDVGVSRRTTSKIPSFCKKIKLTSSTKNCTTCIPF